MENFQNEIIKSQFSQRLHVAIASNDLEFFKSLEDEFNKAFNDVIEKGKPAQIGEIRNWNGTDYRKVASGKWEEVRSGGRESSVAIGGGKGTVTQRSRELSQKVDQAEAAKAARRRKNSETRKKIKETYKELKDLEYDVYVLRDDLADAKSDRKYLLIDMEEEVGAAPEEKKDEVGNRYGGELNDIEEKIKKLENELGIKEEALASAEDTLYTLNPEFNRYQYEYDADK